MRRYALIALVGVGLVALLLLLRSNDDDPFWTLPPGQPAPAVPTDNPMNAAKVKLGRWLFYDVRLSGNETMSCATCHLQGLAFTDGKARSVGSTGVQHPRSAMSLVNVAYASRLTWANPLLARLEDQALTPLFGDDPVEMGLGGREERLAELLASDARYRELTAEAFPSDENPNSIVNAIRAISAFVRTIVSFNSPYDRFLAGETDAMSPAALRGMELFFSERAECFHCHGGFNFTDSSTHANSRVDRVGFHNTGLYNLNGSGQYPPDNTGLYDMTGNTRDMGRFKAPSLRNVGLTAPYMHDGSIDTLENVIRHYERGGRLLENGDLAGDGKLSPYKSEFVRGIELTDSERADLLAFLHTLTDPTIATDERWSDPFVTR